MLPLKASSVCETDELEEFPCICLLLLWGLGQISLGYSETPQNVSVQEASGCVGSNHWTCPCLQAVGERQKEPLSNQNLFLMKEQWGDAIDGATACPTGGASVVCSCGDVSIPVWWQQLLFPGSMRTGPQIHLDLFVWVGVFLVFFF